MKKIIFTIFITLLSCNSQNVSKENVDVETFKKGIKLQNVQLVDIRTKEEYEEGHIENALNIDYYSDNFNTEIQKLNKQQPIYIYCESGTRSAEAVIILKELNFNTIVDLQGGYNAWSNN